VGGTFNNHAIGVLYTFAEQKWGIFNQDYADMPVGAAFNVLIPATSANVFVHEATPPNIVGNHTFIDHPLTNNNPNATVLVTQNWLDQDPVITARNNHPTGVYYSNSAQQWAVFNQDRADMRNFVHFNVLVLATGADVFLHTATDDNSTGSRTYIDHPLTNNNPNAILFVTSNWNPGGGISGAYNNHTVGVRYLSGSQKWAIFNQDDGDMPVDAAFNVLVPTTDQAVFVHTATDDNSAGSRTYINHTLANENPNAIIFVTQNWNPGGAGIGVYNDHPIGVYYFSGAQKWGIFNQDAADMPPGAAFNVLIPSVDTSVFVLANTGGNSTSINNPLANNNYANLFITQNLNPSGSGYTYNNHTIGVKYSYPSLRWSIFNQDESDVPEDAAFNVLIPPPGTNVFVHTATNPAVNYPYINHLLTNNNPNATVLITQNLNPGGVGDGVYNNQSIGVFYSTSMQKWAIFNQDTTANMPLDAAFNVLVVFNKIYLPIILR